MNKTSFKKLSITASLLLLSLFNLTGCPGDSSPASDTTTYTDPVECDNQTLPVGIIGNTACPYQGAYDPNLGYQSYSIQFSGSVGIGFYIDFGWDYSDMCPQVGQLPVFQNGSFSHCSGVNPTFAQTDFRGFTQPNTGECTGEQYNMEITGCRANLRPTYPAFR
ncbi:MAG: hypothetical protein ACRBBP_01970 [Bdellovibrionales bacterium]